MTRLIAWGVAATAMELGGLLGVVHTLLRYGMTARGLPSWRVADTLLTSPLLWLGGTLALAAVNWLLVGALLRPERGDAAAGAPAVALGAVLVGAAMMWFGLRAVGKLY